MKSTRVATCSLMSVKDEEGNVRILFYDPPRMDAFCVLNPEAARQFAREIIRRADAIDQNKPGAR